MERILRATTSIVILVLGLVGHVTAQTLVIDWQQRTMTQCPAELDRASSGTYTIQNVNRLAYSYDINASLIEKVPPNPLIDILSPPIVTKAAGASECEKSFDSLKAILLGEVLPANANPPHSLKLSESRAGLVKLEAAIKSFEAKGCNTGTLANAYDKFMQQVREVRRYLNETAVTRPLEFRPNYSYQITVRELYNGVLTDVGEKTFTCTPQSHSLTLSFGTIMSRLEERSYSSRKVPDTTENQLIVEGTGRYRPQLAALFHYELPHFSNTDWGINLAAGPTLKVTSGKADTSNFGFFMGGGVHIRRLLYITPGLHVGQFADFPAGFYPGRPVPANFGELSPVKRWTTRFAIGVTFRTPDFNRILGSGSDNKSAPAGPATSPTGSQKPTPTATPAIGQ